MNETQRNALIDAIEAAFAQAGITDLYAGAQSLRRWVDEQYPILQAAESRDSLATYLTSADDTDTGRVDQFITLALAFPALAQSFVADTVKKTSETIPNGTPGRPNALTTEQKQDIVATVARLHHAGVRVGDAQTRAAQHFGVARRTVQRVWSARRTIGQTRPASLADVFHRLTSV